MIKELLICSWKIRRILQVGGVAKDDFSSRLNSDLADLAMGKEG